MAKHKEWEDDYNDDDHVGHFNVQGFPLVTLSNLSLVSQSVMMLLLGYPEGWQEERIPVKGLADKILQVYQRVVSERGECVVVPVTRHPSCGDKPYRLKHYAVAEWRLADYLLGLAGLAAFAELKGVEFIELA